MRQFGGSSRQLAPDQHKAHRRSSARPQGITETARCPVTSNGQVLFTLSSAAPMFSSIEQPSAASGGVMKGIVGSASTSHCANAHRSIQQMTHVLRLGVIPTVVSAMHIFAEQRHQAAWGGKSLGREPKPRPTASSNRVLSKPRQLVPTLLPLSMNSAGLNANAHPIIVSRDPSARKPR